eukprot:2033828-Alexandrium_andersonii.AAC.1
MVVILPAAPSTRGANFALPRGGVRGMRGLADRAASGGMGLVRVGPASSAAAARGQTPSPDMAT